MRTGLTSWPMLLRKDQHAGTHTVDFGGNLLDGHQTDARQKADNGEELPTLQGAEQTNT